MTCALTTAEQGTVGYDAALADVEIVAIDEGLVFTSWHRPTNPATPTLLVKSRSRHDLAPKPFNCQTKTTPIQRHGAAD